MKIYMSEFLDLETFLKHFPIIKMSRNEFMDKFMIMYSTPQSLREIFELKPTKTVKGKDKTIIKDINTDKRYLRREEIIDYFYEIIITGRHKYLSCFYSAYFEFKDPHVLDWDTGDKKIIISYPETFAPYGVVSSQKNDASRRIVRNLYYLELLDKTKVTNTVKSHVSFWESLCNMYNKLQLEDRFFAPSSIEQVLKEKKTKKNGVTINYNTLFYLFQAYQPKASIFNPYTIKWSMDKLLVPSIKTTTPKGKLKIFTPVLSWSSYLLAYMHSKDFSHYVGVDVMPTVCRKSQFLADWYHNSGTNFKSKTSEFYCQPSESLLNDNKFINKYKEDFDCILVCPPYYDMEIYPEGQQSIDLYHDYNTWLKNYWGKTVEMCYKVTKKGGIFAFIGNNYQSLKGKKIPLTEDLQSIVEQCYTPIDMVYLQNRTSPLRVNAKDRTERMYIYIKN